MIRLTAKMSGEVNKKRPPGKTAVQSQPLH